MATTTLRIGDRIVLVNECSETVQKLVNLYDEAMARSVTAQIDATLALAAVQGVSTQIEITLNQEAQAAAEKAGPIEDNTDPT